MIGGALGSTSVAAPAPAPARSFTTLVLALAAGAVAFAFLLVPAGVRPLIVESGSMSPTLETGDVIFTEMIRPYEANVGDVVTFSDPSRAGRLVTHRVVEVEDLGHSLVFVTRGDANTGVERWGIGEDERIGRLALRIPKAGRLVAWGSSPTARFGLLAAAVLTVGGILLRRVWRV